MLWPSVENMAIFLATDFKVFLLQRVSFYLFSPIFFFFEHKEKGNKMEHNLDYFF